MRYPLRIALGLACTVAAANFQLLIPKYLGAAVDHAQALLAHAGTAAEAPKPRWLQRHCCCWAPGCCAVYSPCFKTIW